MVTVQLPLISILCEQAGEKKHSLLVAKQICIFAFDVQFNFGALSVEYPLGRLWSLACICSCVTVLLNVQTSSMIHTRPQIQFIFALNLSTALLLLVLFCLLFSLRVLQSVCLLCCCILLQQDNFPRGSIKFHLIYLWPFRDLFLFAHSFTCSLFLSVAVFHTAAFIAWVNL